MRTPKSERNIQLKLDCLREFLRSAERAIVVALLMHSELFNISIIVKSVAAQLLLTITAYIDRISFRHVVGVNPFSNSSICTVKGYIYIA